MPANDQNKYLACSPFQVTKKKYARGMAVGCQGIQLPTPPKSHSLLAEMAEDKIAALTRDGRPPIHASVIAKTHGDRAAPEPLAFWGLSRL